MKPKSAIAKGKILEEFIAEELRKSGLDPRAYRQKGSGNGLNKGDIWNALNLCIEAKNQKNFNRQWAKEVVKDSQGSQIPLIVWHPPNVPLNESSVIIDWEFFKELLLCWKASQGTEMISNPSIPAWKLKKLKDDINSVLKDL